MRQNTNERVYIEDIIGELMKRIKTKVSAFLDGLESEEDREWDAFIDRLVAVREGKAPPDDGWICCEERQPMKPGSYLTTTKAGAVRVNRFYGDQWGHKNNAVAWRPLPDPWRAKT